MPDAVPEAVTLLLAYLLGSIPVAWLIFRYRTGGDLRRVGDRNVGAANAVREGATRFDGVLIILADIGKGLLAVAVARWWSLEIGWWVAAGALVMTGHMFPIFLRFNGGRAAATALGAAGAFIPWQFGVTFIVGGLTYLITGIAELGILLVAAPLPFLAIAFDARPEAIGFCFAAPIAAGLKAGLDRYLRARSARAAAPVERA